MSAERKSWHPIKNKDGELDWLCDSVGDCYDDMIEMWNRLCELDPELPKEGWSWPSND